MTVWAVPDRPGPIDLLGVQILPSQSRRAKPARRPHAPRLARHERALTRASLTSQFRIKVPQREEARHPALQYCARTPPSLAGALQIFITTRQDCQPDGPSRASANSPRRLAQGLLPTLPGMCSTCQDDDGQDERDVAAHITPPPNSHSTRIQEIHPLTLRIHANVDT
jgi:hypothetical protein